MQGFSFTELLNRYTYVKGELSMPCVPALLATYMNRIDSMFINLGKPFNTADLDKLREMLASYLQQGFKAGTTTYLTLKYSPSTSPDTGINYTVSYATNPVIKTAHNNRDLEIRVPAMVGVQSIHKLAGKVHLSGKSTTLTISNVGVNTKIQNPLSVPNFLKIVNQYTQVNGEIVMPCMPSFLNIYMAKLEKLFISIGKDFSKDDLSVLRKLLQENLVAGLNHSPLSKIVIKYESLTSPNTGVNYNIAYSLTSIAEQYQSWVDTRTPPLFGKQPDAKVIDTIAQLGEPSQLKTLDIGAGTGRNTLPLAKLGCQAEALELAPALVQQLKKDALAQGLNVKAIEGDILDPQLELQVDTYNLIVCAEVVASHFRNVEQIQVLLEKVSKSLCHGGLFLFNLFVVNDSYQPNAIAREFSEVVWSSLFTNQDLDLAFANLPLAIISNESVFEYEHSHLASEDWPPTGWFEHWAKGKDLFRFEESPMELRWVLCRRT
jgi:2-polyprenyl-3-methyl-5-hydroxy-6-metoxy-1,4-benzoquinol methylase